MGWKKNEVTLLLTAKKQAQSYDEHKHIPVRYPVPGKYGKHALKKNGVCDLPNSVGLET